MELKEQHRAEAVERARQVMACLVPENRKTCDVVLFGDYCLPSPEWKGELPLRPIAVSTSKPTADVPVVRVFAMGDVSGSKYWELPGSEGHAEKVAIELWLPQVVANELYERMLSEGEESVPRGEFIEEACNEGGESVLVHPRLSP